MNLYVDKSKHQQHISDTYINNMVVTAEIKTKSVIFMDGVIFILSSYKCDFSTTISL